MANTMEWGEDDGYVDVVIPGSAAVRLDVWRTVDLVHDYHQANKGLPDVDYNEGLVQLLTSLGLPGCSFGMAARFVRQMQQRADALKKNLAPSPASPASTEPPPSS